MAEPDLIERRQYAERIMASMNLRIFRVDLVIGVVYVQKKHLSVIRKLIKKMGWPLQCSINKRQLALYHFKPTRALL